MDTILNVEKYKAHIYDVIGAVCEVHKELGPGLSEYGYQEDLMLQLTAQGIPFAREIFGTDGNVKQFI